MNRYPRRLIEVDLPCPGGQVLWASGPGSSDGRYVNAARQTPLMLPIVSDGKLRFMSSRVGNIDARRSPPEWARDDGRSCVGLHKEHPI